MVSRAKYWTVPICCSLVTPCGQDCFVQLWFVNKLSGKSPGAKNDTDGALEPLVRIHWTRQFNYNPLHYKLIRK